MTRLNFTRFDMKRMRRKLFNAAPLAGALASPVVSPLVSLLLSPLVSSLVSSLAIAQSFPTKPIRIIVPAVPGSAVDVNARRIAPKLGELLGQPILVENRAGANSAIGAREVARAAPDGYTIFQGNVNNSLNDLLTSDTSARLNAELIPITRLFGSPLMMLVHPSVPANNLREYIELAKAKPQTVTFASGGTGAITQLLGERVKAAAGINIREIPYKSIGAELPDLTAGHVMTAFLVPGVVTQFIKGGKLRALAVAGPRRVSILPEVPTMAEAGLPGVEAAGWNGLFAPAGTPSAIINRLQQAVTQTLNQPDIRDEAATFGSEIGGDRPEEFGAYVRNEIARWGKVIKDAGIKLE